MLIGFFAGLVFGAGGVWVATEMMAGGHGTYQPAAALFPYAMLLAADGLTPLLMALAIIQYPAYGVIIATARRPRVVCLVLAGVHFVAALKALAFF